MEGVTEVPICRGFRSPRSPEATLRGNSEGTALARDGGRALAGSHSLAVALSHHRRGHWGAGVRVVGHLVDEERRGRAGPVLGDGDA
jgi:hypothetical protein